MIQSEYEAILRNILAMHTEAALHQLDGIRNTLSQKAKSVEVGIHLPQDEEGFFSIVVHPIGPDLFVLNKSIEPYRYLFDVRFIDGKLQPEVPLFEPDDVSFSVNDVIVDVSMGWLKHLWEQSGGVGLPAQAFGEDGYGSVGSIRLLP
jgi:hypothetical protein